MQSAAEGEWLLPAAAALFSAASWAVAALLFARLLSGSGAAGGAGPSASAANLFKNALASAVFLAAFVLMDGQWPAWEAWPWLLASGFFGFALGDTLFFAALPLIGAQKATVATQVHVPGTVILAWLMLGEQLPLATLAAMPVVIAGILLVVLDRRQAGPARTRPLGVVLAASGALCGSAAVVLGHQGMEGSEVLGGTLVRMLGGIAGTLLCTPLLDLLRPGPRRAWPRLFEPWRRREWWRALLIAALFGSVIGLPCFHYALRALPGGVASVLFATTPLFTLPLAFAFGERHGLRALLGTLLGFAGVVLLVRSLG